MSATDILRRFLLGSTFDSTLSEDLIEAVVGTDSVATVQAYLAILQEAVTGSDSVQDAIVTTNETLSESVSGIITGLDQKVFPPEELTDLATVVDTLQELYGLIETVTEQVASLDTVADVQTYLQQLTDAATGAPTVTELQTYLHTLAELGASVDAVTDALVGVLAYIPRMAPYVVPGYRTWKVKPS